MSILYHGYFRKSIDFAEFSVFCILAQNGVSFFMDNVQTSNIIKALCKANRVSITRLLTDCNLTKSFIYDLEQRKTCPSVDKIERIADYLDCSVDYLLGRTDVPEVNRKLTE